MESPITDEVFRTITQAQDLKAKIKSLWNVGASTSADHSILLSRANDNLDETIMLLGDLAKKQDGR